MDSTGDVDAGGAPDPTTVRAYTRARIAPRSAALGTFEGLSPLAHDALYLLLRAGVAPKVLHDFLMNPATEDPYVGGADAILRIVALCYEHRVEGYDAGFRPDEIDAKFLSNTNGRVHSQLVEYQYALWRAANTDARSVRLNPTFTVDWHRREDGDLIGLIADFADALPEDLRATYRSQTSVTLDAITAEADGRGVIIEVKTTHARTWAPNDGVLAATRLQIIRQALLVRQHPDRLRGIELVIQAEGANGAALAALRETLEATNVPYLIHLVGGTEHRLITATTVARQVTYDVTDAGIAEQRTRMLPSLPAVEESERAEEDGAEGPIIPWTPAMQRWLSKMLPFKPARMRIEQFVERAIHDLRVADQALVAERITEWLDAEKPTAVAAIRAALENFRRGKDNILSRQRAIALIEAAAYATGTPWTTDAAGEDAVEEATRLDVDWTQRLTVEQRAIEAALGSVLAGVQGDLEGVEGLLDDVAIGRTRATLQEIRAELAALDPDRLPIMADGLGGRPVNLRALAALMADTSALQWPPSLIDGLAGTLERYDAVAARVEATWAGLPVPSPVPVEQVFAPLPGDILRDLRRQVLAFGALPVRVRRQTPPEHGRAKGPATFDPAQVHAIYARVILVHAEGDSDHRYYFPEDLDRQRQLAKLYLQRCGWDAARITAELLAMEEAAVRALGGVGEIVRALTEIVPAHFQRTDQITTIDRFSGAPLDVTAVVKGLWRSGPHEDVSRVVRVVVMPKGRRVYFTDWAALIQMYPQVMWQMPTEQAWITILRQPTVLRAFLNAMRERKGESPIVWGRGVTVWVEGIVDFTSRQIYEWRVVRSASADLSNKKRGIFGLSIRDDGSTCNVAAAKGNGVFLYALTLLGHTRDSLPHWMNQCLALALGTQFRMDVQPTLPHTALAATLHAASLRDMYALLRRVDPMLPEFPSYLV